MRGGKSDAGGPEKQLILFVWPNKSYPILHVCMVYAEIFARRKFSPISPPALDGKNFINDFLSCFSDYIEDIMATFTALAKFIPLNISAIQR